MATNTAPAPRKEKRSINDNIRSLLAGGLAGSAAKTVVAPLDRVKILFQASNPRYKKYSGSLIGAFRAGNSIYSEVGVRGLFQGHSATLLRVFPSAAIRAVAYDNLRARLMPTQEKETNSRRFLAGALSGITSTAFTYPLDVIHVRMAYRAGLPGEPPMRLSVVGAVRQICTEKAGQSVSSRGTTAVNDWMNRIPALKLYRGFNATIIGAVPYTGVSFLTWEFLQSTLLPRNKSDKRHIPIANLAIGAAAGAVAQTVSYPLDIIRRRMQVGGITSPDRWLGWNETARAIWNSGGWRGFYVGMGLGYVRVMPATAVSFMTWQWAKKLLDI